MINSYNQYLLILPQTYDMPLLQSNRANKRYVIVHVKQSKYNFLIFLAVEKQHRYRNYLCLDKTLNYPSLHMHGFLENDGHKFITLSKSLFHTAASVPAIITFNRTSSTAIQTDITYKYHTYEQVSISCTLFHCRR